MRDTPACELLLRVYGDSLSLPRANDGVGHRQTYAEVLAEDIRVRFPAIALSLYNRSGGGLTIDALHERYLHDCSYFGTPAHQVLIIQCGIVDCAPRPIPTFLRAIIGKLPGRVRAPITGFLHRARPQLLGAGFSWRLTTPYRFTKVLVRWLAHATGTSTRVYVVNIAPAGPGIATHSPGLAASIDAYNALIAQAVATAVGSAVLVDVHAAITSAADVAMYVSASDGHHITREGNRLYANLILEYERRRLDKASAAAVAGGPP
ncbi:MAG: hypothetical protein ACREUW_03795 [Burkholderiales bacterium]